MIEQKSAKQCGFRWVFIEVQIFKKVGTYCRFEMVYLAFFVVKRLVNSIKKWQKLAFLKVAKYNKSRI